MRKGEATLGGHRFEPGSWLAGEPNGEMSVLPRVRFGRVVGGGCVEPQRYGTVVEAS